jgi:ATP-dependent Lon protease
MNSETLSTDSQDIDRLLNQAFAGRVVRKDLTTTMKQGANVPVYVLEYLLGMYCASDDEEIIQTGLTRVKAILADNYVRPDESEKIKSKIRENGTYKVIDRIQVKLNERRDCYEAALSNLGITGVEIQDRTVKENEKLLAGGIWAIVTVQYFFEEGMRTSPFSVVELKPIQMPNFDLQEVLHARRSFTEDQWLDALLRSSGMEPANLPERAKWHLLARMIPFVENNFNMCELGPRSTGKSHLYKEISPNSILVSGGQTTVANLFYNMASRTVGLVGLWDVVAFDEVAGIRFKDQDGVQIMKDYMASGSFARGKDQVNADASMVFVGNIDTAVDILIKTSHLLAPFPESMIDTAFFDRFHLYIPGWEVPKFRPEFFTRRYGLIVDYLAEFWRTMRKHNFADAIDRYFLLGKDLNQRDSIAVRRTVSGLLKLLHPDGQFEKDSVQKCLEYALEGRRRVKEQLKKLGGMEFFDVHFSYIDKETSEERFVTVPEQGGGSLIPEGELRPGFLHTIGISTTSNRAVYRIETQVMHGNGKFTPFGVNANGTAKESLRTALDYLKGNAQRLVGQSKIGESDIQLSVVELMNVGAPKVLTLAGLVAMTSALTGKSVQGQMVVLGEMSLGGSVQKVDGLAETLQLALDAGARKVLLPMANAADIATVPPELFTKFQTSFYADPVDAVYKALGVS